EFAAPRITRTFFSAARKIHGLFHFTSGRARLALAQSPVHLPDVGLCMVAPTNGVATCPDGARVSGPRGEGTAVRTLLLEGIREAAHQILPPSPSCKRDGICFGARRNKRGQSRKPLRL